MHTPASRLVGAHWRKSRHSGKLGNCVELAAVGGTRVAVRNSRFPDEAALVMKAIEAARAAVGREPAPPANVETPNVSAENWPCWRGPRGDGSSLDTRVPREWNATTNENIVWKAVVPYAAMTRVSGAGGITRTVNWAMER